MQTIYKNLKNLNFKALTNPKVVSRNSAHNKNLTTVNGDSSSIKITESGGHQKSTTKISGQLKTAFQTQAQAGQNAQRRLIPLKSKNPPVVHNQLLQRKNFLAQKTNQRKANTRSQTIPVQVSTASNKKLGAKEQHLHPSQANSVENLDRSRDNLQVQKTVVPESKKESPQKRSRVSKPNPAKLKQAQLAQEKRDLSQISLTIHQFRNNSNKKEQRKEQQALRRQQKTYCDESEGSFKSSSQLSQSMQLDEQAGIFDVVEQQELSRGASEEVADHRGASSKVELAQHQAPGRAEGRSGSPFQASNPYGLNLSQLPPSMSNITNSRRKVCQVLHQIGKQESLTSPQPGKDASPPRLESQEFTFQNKPAAAELDHLEAQISSAGHPLREQQELHPENA